MNTQPVTIIKEVALPSIASTYLSDNQIAIRYGVSRQTVWRWAANDSAFPTPVKLSPGCTRWKLSDIESWEASKGGAA